MKSDLGSCIAELRQSHSLRSIAPLVLRGGNDETKGIVCGADDGSVLLCDVPEAVTNRVNERRSMKS